MKYIHYLRSYMLHIIVGVLTMGALAGCSDEDEMQQNLYGYVQFKLLKSASAADIPLPRAADELEMLADAKKIEVIMQHEGSTIAQPLVLNAYYAANAEFGLRSD